jgi:hypothetical protein
MKVTVNKLLAMEKSLRERLNQLKELEVKTAKVSIWDDKDKREEPTYDVRKVDKKITELNKALFEINYMVKESNAKTLVEVNLDYNDLVSGIE